MFEGTFSPPEYTDMYNFAAGAQNDIFEDSYKFPLPVPSPNQKGVPKFLKEGGINSTNTGGIRADEVSRFLGGKAPEPSRGAPPNTAIAVEPPSSSASSSSSNAASTTAKPDAGATTVVTATQTVVVTSTAVVTATATKARRALDAHHSAAVPSLQALNLTLAFLATLICTTFVATNFW
jgi:hypothetical protein